MRASWLKARAAKRRNLSGSPKSHMVGWNNSYKLSSNFYRHAVVHTGHTCIQDRQTDNKYGGVLKEKKKKKSKMGAGSVKKSSRVGSWGSGQQHCYALVFHKGHPSHLFLINSRKSRGNEIPGLWLEVPALLKSVMKV